MAESSGVLRFGAACIYGADGAYSCPQTGGEGGRDAFREGARLGDGRAAFREGFFAAFVGPFDTPHQYIPPNFAAAAAAQAVATTSKTASAASIAQARSSANAATKAAAAQQADWAAVQTQAGEAVALVSSDAALQMADQAAFVAAQKAADDS